MQLASLEHAFFNPISTSPFSSPDSELICSFEEEARADPIAILDPSFEFELGGLEVLLSQGALLEDFLHSQSRLFLPISNVR